MLRSLKKLRVYIFVIKYVLVCSNNTFGKNGEKGISFYSFPKDENLKKRW